MLSTKIRTAAISLIAASSLAAAIAPAASAAPNIPGRFQKSSEGLKAQITHCDEQADRYGKLVNAGEGFLQEGKTEGALAAFDAAKHVREAAGTSGCLWAQF